MAADSTSAVHATPQNCVDISSRSVAGQTPTKHTSSTRLSSWREESGSIPSHSVPSHGSNINCGADVNGISRLGANPRADVHKGSERRTKNLFLRSLSESLWSRLSPHIGQSLMIQGQLLLDPAQRVDRVYFPNGGLVSLVVGEGEGSQVEVGVIGREGVVGAPSLLTSRRTFTRAMVQVPHTCSWLPIEALSQEFSHDIELQGLLMRQVGVLVAQSSQSALCNRLHTVEERLCRWLLTIRDRIQSDEIEITHEFIGYMLGTRRSSVSIALGALQRADFVEVGRGHITLLNDVGIGECACDCYTILRDQFETLNLK